MKPYYQDEQVTLYCGDNLEVMSSLAKESISAIVTDPPYGLRFMGRQWDYEVPSVETWRLVFDLLKPGGHLLSFAGTRTQHRMAVNIEDAGFEIRDMIAWVYGSGFPKSLDVSKAIDKAAGAEREVVRTPMTPKSTAGKGLSNELDERPWMSKARERGYHEHAGNIPATEAAKQWQGWGTALKPALEPITVARKPFKGTVASNVLEHGTGGLNIDGCRVGTDGGTTRSDQAPYADSGWRTGHTVETINAGRWPANLIHDGSDEVVGLFPVTTSGAYSKQSRKRKGFMLSGSEDNEREANAPDSYGDTGSAARFFYCAKASKRDRDEGCEGLPQTTHQSVAHGDKKYGTLPYTNEPREMNPLPRANHHPTVKPTDLMAYLCRLVTPPSGLILDPFMGSGSTGKAAVREGFRFIGIEQSEEYCEIALARIKHEIEKKKRDKTLFD